MALRRREYAEWIPWLSGLLVMGAWPVSAQEALFNSLTDATMAAQRDRQLEQAPYTVRWGDLRLLVSPALAFAWNSNVNLSDAGAESDFILTPSLNVNSLYPIGERNVLSFYVTVGYSKYFDHSELDQLNVQPGSALSFDVFVKDLRINLHDRLSYQLNPTLEGAVSDVSEFGGWNNTAGLLLTWNLQDVVLDLGYDFVSFINTAPGFDYLTRNSHQLVARSGFKVHPGVTVGVEAGGGPTAYQESYLNDTVNYSLGGYLEWQVSENIRLQGRGGYTVNTFTPNAVMGDVPNYDAFYFGLQFNHRVSEAVTYSINAGRQVRPGTYGDLTDEWTANATVTWSVIKDVPLTTGLSYENGEQVGGVIIPDQYQRVGATVGLSYQLTEKLLSSLSYSFYVRNSDGNTSSYTQNLVTLTLSYRF